MDYVREQLIFETNAFLLIEEMVEMESETEEDTSDLLDEVKGYESWCSRLLLSTALK